MIAAISIPGAFPPVLIEVEANGKRFEEMHVDGGLGGQFYVAPEFACWPAPHPKLPATRPYIIANMKLDCRISTSTERTTLGILGRTVAYRDQVRDPQRASTAPMRPPSAAASAFISPLSIRLFRARARAFDPDYMKALYEVGFAKGKAPNHSCGEPPDYSSRPNKGGPVEPGPHKEHMR